MFNNTEGLSRIICTNVLKKYLYLKTAIFANAFIYLKLKYFFMKKMNNLLSALLLFALLIPSALWSQENVTYQKPPKEILDLANTQRPPTVTMDDKKEYMVFSYRNAYRTLEDLAQDELRLAGLRINPITSIQTGTTYVTNVTVRKSSESNEIQVNGLPAEPKISNMSFSPNNKFMAFTHTTSKGVELWVLEVATAQAKKVSNIMLNAIIGSPYSWMKDNRSFLVKAIPANRPAVIKEDYTAIKGPAVSVSDGVAAENPTYQDLLKNKIDEANFITLITSELRIVDLDGGNKPFKGNGLYIGTSMSPDGSYIMLTTIEEPFSYMVPYSRFPQRSIVYDMTGKLIKEVNSTPLTESIPRAQSSTTSGKRSMMWRADKPATLTYVVALDGGDAAKEVEYRDELFQWVAPFDAPAQSMAKTPQRFSRVQWGNDQYAFITDSWGRTRNTKTYLINPSNPAQKPIVITDRNTQDRYSDPGSIETKENEWGRNIALIDKDNVYLIGAGFTAQGQFPFIDELNLKTLKTTRLYQSTYTDKSETIQSIEDLKAGKVLVMIQSQTDYPNYYIRDIKKKSNNLTQLTSFENPYAIMANVHKEVIKYTRADGVELSGTLYLPVGYDKAKKEKVPLLIWAYPREYNDPAMASQSTHNPNTFTTLSYGSFVYWVTRGYAVLDDAAFPIVGFDGKEPNDTFVEQLVASAKAAIDAVDAMGYIDRSRVGVGGHSYGGFMTAHLLTYSDLFACGVARSGAYNRTLTPFGFQNETRNYWTAREVYTTMSPFLNADKMKHPILLIHGAADDNTGTFTIQSERYFAALKALGVPARMVLLPMEKHGYAAEENIFHVLWETDQFFEKYLKK